MTCQAEECTRPAARAGLCWSHYDRRRKQRAGGLGPLRAWGRKPWELVTEAMHRYTDASSEDDHEAHAARVYLAVAIHRHHRKLKK